MSLRIAVGGFMHETNTFVAKPTTWNDFVEAGPWPSLTIGEGVLSTFRGINLAIAYFMDAAEKAGHVMVPLAWGGASLFATWSWMHRRRRVVLAPLCTIALLLAASNAS